MENSSLITLSNLFKEIDENDKSWRMGFWEKNYMYLWIRTLSSEDERNFKF